MKHEAELNLDYSKNVEDLISELREIETTFLNLNTSEMPERTQGFVQGVLQGLKVAVRPPSPEAVEFIKLIAEAYERKYGREPEKSAEETERLLAQAKTDHEEFRQQPDYAEKVKAWEKYEQWPQGKF